jgi:hypothetical protein
VIDEAEVLVVTNGSNAFREIAAVAREDQIIIDFVGNSKQASEHRNGNYKGICW